METGASIGSKPPATSGRKLQPVTSRLRWRPLLVCCVLAAAVSAGCGACGNTPSMVVLVRYEGFRPRCLRVSAHPEGRPAEDDQTYFPLENPEQAGQRRVGIYAHPGWGDRLTVLA